MAEARRLETKKGMVVITTLTDREALDGIRTLTDSFARKLATDSYGRRGLSTDQLTWAHKLVIDAQTPVAARPAAPKIDIGSLTALIEMFDHAKLHLKFPKIRLSLPGPDLIHERQELCLSIAGERSRTPGVINITDGGKYGNNRYFGRIFRDGNFQPSMSAAQPAGLVEFLVAFAERPAEMAAEYGRLTGNCCFCHSTLKDERSTAVGYGPICAKHFHLDWGPRRGWNQRQPEVARANAQSWKADYNPVPDAPQEVA